MSTALAINQQKAPAPATPHKARETALAAQSSTQAQVAALVAQSRPRDEDMALQRIYTACQRPMMAEEAEYSYPRGKTQVQGASVKLLRAIAGYWGNIEYGYEVLGETPEGATIRAYAWDLENNTRAQRDHFVERKVLRGGNNWAVPDLRDWREWLGNIGSRMERRALENVIPADVVEYARAAAAETRLKHVGSDPDAARRKVLESFTSIGVTAEDLTKYLGFPLKSAGPTEIDTLRNVYRAIRDGEKKWSDYFAPKPETIAATIDPSQVKPSNSPNRGHDATEPKPEPTDQELDALFAQEEQQEAAPAAKAKK